MVKTSVLWIASLELPICQLDAYLFTILFTSQHVDDVEHLYEIFLGTFSEVGGVKMEDPQFGFLDDVLEYIEYVEEDVLFWLLPLFWFLVVDEVIDLEPIEDDFE